MKKKLRAAISDPQFIVLVITAAVMIALGVAAALMYGQEQLRTVLSVVYFLYVPFAFFFFRALFRLYKKHFYEKKPKRSSKLINKLKTVLRSAEEKLRRLLDLKPKLAFFGGEDSQTGAEDVYDGSEPRRRADGRIKWSSLRKNEEKLRYLYAQRVHTGIEEGAGITASDTARQVRSKLGGDDPRDDVLFSLYESVRYTDHNEQIDDGTVSYLSSRTPAAASKGAGRKKK